MIFQGVSPCFRGGHSIRSTTAPKPVTTPMPVPLSAPGCTAFIVPHLSRPKRGPQCQLGSARVFTLRLWGLDPGRQGQGWPLPHDTQGQPALHSTPVSTGLAPWAAAGSLWQAGGARVRPRAVEQQRALRVLHGAGPNPVAPKGARAWAARGTPPRRASRAWPAAPSRARGELPAPGRPSRQRLGCGALRVCKPCNPCSRTLTELIAFVR